MVAVTGDHTAVDTSHAMKNKKPQQPCYIQRNVWQQQMSQHIKRLEVLGRAPSEGCTVAHVILHCEVEEIVKHGAMVIHLSNPMRDQVTGNISWAVQTPGVLDDNGEMLLTKSALF